MERVYVNDNLVVVNNKYENLLFIYDRIQRAQYNINKTTYFIIKKIKKHKYTLKGLQKEIGEEITENLLKLEIITLEKQKNINNIKAPKKHNNARIFAEITNRCNLKCKHCYGSFGPSNELEINLKLLKKLIDNAALNGVYQFDLTGGEPLLYTKIEELLKYLYNAGMLVRIFSNLTVFPKKIQNLILKYGVKDIVTSVDSCKKQVHDEFRGSIGSFDKTLKSIQDLKDMGIGVTVNTMIGNHNKDHLDEIVALIKKLEVKSVLDIIISEGRATSLKTDALSSAFLIKGIYTKHYDFIDLGSISISCGVGNRFIYIKSDGNIYICPNLISEKYKLGNIKGFNTNRLWEKMYLLFGNLMCDKKNDKCGNCNGGCRARALTFHGDLCNCDDVYCIINGVKTKK